MKRSVFAFVFLIAMSAAAQTTQLPAQASIRDFAADTISVTGVGKVTAAPDRVSFTAGVETSAPTVDDAVAQNNRRTAALLSALKAAGATEKDLRTSNFSVFPQYEYIENRRPRVVGFQVVNSVTVTRPKPEEAGRLLTAAVNAGANQVSGLTFSLNDQQAARNRGLQLAFEDARTKAQLLAAAAGRSVGRAISIVEGTAPMERPPMFMRAQAMEAKAADMSVAVETGVEELAFNLSVVFELK